MAPISFTINGKAVDVTAAPETPLLWVVREHLQLTGTKYGCGAGMCGACTVHVEGQPARACQMPVSSIGKRKIGVFHLEDGSWHAIDNVCSHAFALLTEGFLDGDEIECPLHAGSFDCRTGKGQGAPIEEDLKTYAVRIAGDDILIELPA